MANLKLKNPSGGSLNLVSADGASDLTVTFPATTGTAMVSGNMPAFSAYAGVTASLTDAGNTIMPYNVEFFDTASCYNNTGSTVGSIPAYSFLPNVAGYYQINANHNVSYAGGSTNMALQFFKNGSQYHISSGVSGATNTYMNASMLVYLNGTTDYVTAYIYWTGSGASTGSGIGYQFSGFLARAA